MRTHTGRDDYYYHGNDPSGVVVRLYGRGADEMTLQRERERGKKVQLPGQMFKNKGKPQLLIRRNSHQAKEIKYHFLIFGNNPGFLIHLLHLDIIAAERE